MNAPPLTARAGDYSTQTTFRLPKVAIYNNEPFKLTQSGYHNMNVSELSGSDNTKTYKNSASVPNFSLDVMSYKNRKKSYYPFQPNSNSSVDREGIGNGKHGKSSSYDAEITFQNKSKDSFTQKVGKNKGNNSCDAFNSIHNDAENIESYLMKQYGRSSQMHIESGLSSSARNNLWQNSPFKHILQTRSRQSNPTTPQLENVLSQSIMKYISFKRKVVNQEKEKDEILTHLLSLQRCGCHKDIGEKFELYKDRVEKASIKEIDLKLNSDYEAKTMAILGYSKSPQKGFNSSSYNQTMEQLKRSNWNLTDDVIPERENPRARLTGRFSRPTISHLLKGKDSNKTSDRLKIALDSLRKRYNKGNLEENDSHNNSKYSLSRPSVRSQKGLLNNAKYSIGGLSGDMIGIQESTNSVNKAQTQKSNVKLDDPKQRMAQQLIPREEFDQDISQDFTDDMSRAAYKFRCGRKQSTAKFFKKRTDNLSAKRSSSINSFNSRRPLFRQNEASLKKLEQKIQEEQQLTVSQKLSKGLEKSRRDLKWRHIFIDQKKTLGLFIELRKNFKPAQIYAEFREAVNNNTNCEWLRDYIEHPNKLKSLDYSQFSENPDEIKCLDILVDDLSEFLCERTFDKYMYNKDQITDIDQRLEGQKVNFRNKYMNEKANISNNIESLENSSICQFINLDARKMGNWARPFNASEQIWKLDVKPDTRINFVSTYSKIKNLKANKMSDSIGMISNPNKENMIIIDKNLIGNNSQSSTMP